MPAGPADATHPNAALAGQLKAAARELGFDLVGIAPAAEPATLGRLHDWLDAGHAGEMGYLERRREAYEHPRSMLPEVRSVLMLGINYRGDEPADLQAGSGRVARYARIPVDYHDVLRDRLKALVKVLRTAVPDSRSRGVVDTAPLLERDFARQAGLGWFGKNTMLINKRQGSWFFLAAVLTSVDLPADKPHETAHCGTCTRCLEACPTDAFVEPYVLDARRCISYLTIELGPKPIAEELQGQTGDWAFGCDVCQEVCPWNRKAPLAGDPAFQAVPDGRSLSLDELLACDEATFRSRWKGTPLERTGHEALLRNVCQALGNSGSIEDLPRLRVASQNASALVRDAAAKAIQRIQDRFAES